MFLTVEELQVLTGLQQPAAQIRWLVRHGYPHEISAGGKPVVVRSYVEARLGGKPAEQPKTRPNFAALRKVV